MPSRDKAESAPVQEARVVEASESMPDEFPVDFDEWAAAQPGPYRWLVAGYRQRVRTRGDATTKKMREEWDAGFTAFRHEAVR